MKRSILLVAGALLAGLCQQVYASGEAPPESLPPVAFPRTELESARRVDMHRLKIDNSGSGYKVTLITCKIQGSHRTWILDDEELKRLSDGAVIANETHDILYKTRDAKGCAVKSTTVGSLHSIGYDVEVDDNNELVLKVNDSGIIAAFDKVGKSEK